MRLKTSCRFAAVLVALAALDPAFAAFQRLDIKRLQLEELMEIDVYTASRRFEPYMTAPNAVYVLTGEDIRRAGVLSIPEALRLVPGVQVARVDANKWAVSIRGFNGRTANKLLVLVDGRTIYDPLFSGTLWESRDVMLENVERIEVIRGPGGALWGANAVNGVINIITKDAHDTQGGLVAAGGGTEERAFSAARYGWQTGVDQYARIYAEGFERDNGFLPNAATFDETHMYRTGFRWDWDPSPRDDVTVSGDVFQGDAGEFQRGTFPPQTVGHEGGNLIARWVRHLSARESIRVNFFYDRFRLDNLDLGETRDTFDLEVQHSFMPGTRQFLVWGLGYRNVQDDIRNGRLLSVDPPSRVDITASAFVQDTITLAPNKLQLTVGTKLEHNDYTGSEWQPNLRLAWTPDSRRTWWGSVSRAVRVPSRLEADIVSGGVRSGENFDSERVYAYELGYRHLPAPNLWYDVAVFYNDYRGLLTIEPPFVFRNLMDGKTYGLEVASRWQPMPRWRVDVAYTYLKLDLEVRPESTRTDLPASGEGVDPRHQVVLRSAYDFTDGFELDATLRFVDKLRTFDVPAYVALDLGATWYPRRGLALSLVGQNLTDAHHPEWNVASGLGTETERGVYAKLQWEF